jgi:hypothetical protein
MDVFGISRIGKSVLDVWSVQLGRLHDSIVSWEGESEKFRSAMINNRHLGVWAA